MLAFWSNKSSIRTINKINNLEKGAATMIYRGMPVVLSGKPKNGPAFTCFDAREYNGNIIVKLIQRHKWQAILFLKTPVETIG